MRTLCKLAVLAVVLFVGQPVFADFGATVDNESSVTKKDEVDGGQQDSLSLWFSALLGDHLKFDASGRAVVSIDDPKFYADVDKLSFSGDFPSPGEGAPQFSFELGKFYQTDFTSILLAQPVAGLRFVFSYPVTNLKLSMGYTGLNNKHSSSLVLSRLDALDDADGDVTFAPPRVLGVATWEFPEFFLRQTLTFSGVVQEDLRAQFDTVLKEGESTFDPHGGGKVNTQYVGLGLSGPLAPTLFYDLYFYLGTGRVLTFGEDDQSITGQSYQYEAIQSYLFGASFRYYLPAFLNSFASARFLYATGDKDSLSYVEGNGAGSSTAFVPLADGPFGVAFTPKASNLMAAELSYSLKPFAALKGSPLSSLQTVAKVTPFYKVTKGAMSDAAVDPSGKSGYLGTEVAGAVNFRPYSDLGLGASLGVFMPNASQFVDDMDSAWFVGKFTFSFSF